MCDQFLPPWECFSLTLLDVATRGISNARHVNHHRENVARSSAVGGAQYVGTSEYRISLGLVIQFCWRIIATLPVHHQPKEWNQIIQLIGMLHHIYIIYILSRPGLLRLKPCSNNVATVAKYFILKYSRMWLAAGARRGLLNVVQYLGHNDF